MGLERHIKFQSQELADDAVILPLHVQFNFHVEEKGCRSAFDNYYILVFIEAISDAEMYCVMTQSKSAFAYDSNHVDCWFGLCSLQIP